MKKSRSTLAAFLMFVMSIGLCFGIWVSVNMAMAASEPYTSSFKVSPSSVETEGDSFKFSGTLYSGSSGVKITKVNVGLWYDGNSSDQRGFLLLSTAKSCSATSYKLSNLGTFYTKNYNFYEAEYEIVLHVVLSTGEYIQLETGKILEVTEPDNRYLDVDDDSFSFSGKAGSDYTYTDSNTDWEASVSSKYSSWLSVSPTSGYGNKKLTISVKENNTGSARTGYIYVETEDGEHYSKIEVEQEALKKVYATVSNFKLSSYEVEEGESISLSGTINGNGETIDVVNVSIFEEGNHNVGATFSRKTPGTSTYSLSNIAKIKAGQTITDNQGRSITLKAGGSYDVVLYATLSNGEGFESEPTKTFDVVETTYATVSNFKLSSYEVEEGESISLSGTINGNGETIDVVNVSIFEEGNHNVGATFSRKTPGTATYSLSNIEKIKAGQTITDSQGKSITLKAGGSYDVVLYVTLSNGEGFESDPMKTFDVAETTYATVSNFKLSSYEIKEGESLSLSGTINGNGETIDVVNVSVFEEGNHGVGATFARTTPGTGTYSLSNIGSIKAGQTITDSQGKSITLKAGGSYDVVLYVTLSNGEGFEEDPTKTFDVVEATYATVSGFKLSSYEVEIGESISLSGTINGNGETIDVVNVSVFEEGNHGVGATFARMKPGTGTYSLSNIESIKAGQSISDSQGGKITLKSGVSYDVVLYVTLSNGKGFKSDPILTFEINSTTNATVSNYALSTNAAKLGDTINLSGVINGNGHKIEVVQVSVFPTGNHKIGAVAYRNESVNSGTFDLSRIPGIVMGNINGFALEEGKSYDVVLYTTLSNELGFASEPTKVIMITGSTNATVSNYALSTNTAKLGDTVNLSGIINGNGQTIEIVQVSVFPAGNHETGAVAYRNESVNSGTFDLSKVPGIVMNNINGFMLEEGKSYDVVLYVTMSNKLGFAVNPTNTIVISPKALPTVENFTASQASVVEGGAFSVNGTVSGNGRKIVRLRLQAYKVGSGDQIGMNLTNAITVNAERYDLSNIGLIPTGVNYRNTAGDTVYLGVGEWELQLIVVLDDNIGQALTNDRRNINIVNCNVLKLPQALDLVEDETFYGADSLDHVVLHENVVAIGYRAFANSTLKKIFIPDSVTSIADDAFSGCPMVVFSCSSNSAAYRYAQRHSNVVVEVVTSSPTTTPSVTQAPTATPRPTATPTPRPTTTTTVKPTNTTTVKPTVSVSPTIPPDNDDDVPEIVGMPMVTSVKGNESEEGDTFYVYVRTSKDTQSVAIAYQDGNTIKNAKVFQQSDAVSIDKNVSGGYWDWELAYNFQSSGTEGTGYERNTLIRATFDGVNWCEPVVSNNFTVEPATFSPIWPCSAAYKITCIYYYKDGTKHSTKFGYKYGMDIGGGGTIIAVDSGEVTTCADLGSESFGKYIIITHNDGTQSLYAHLASFGSGIKTGVRVEKGQVIGVMGNSGNSDGVHLHFEMSNCDPWAKYYHDTYKQSLTYDSNVYTNNNSFNRDKTIVEWLAENYKLSNGVYEFLYSTTQQPSITDHALIGAISRKYETTAGPGAISSGSGDAGGKSYGSYQFASAKGAPYTFANWLTDNSHNNSEWVNIGNRLINAYNSDGGYGTNFDTTWKDLASVYGDSFYNAQTEYVYEKFYLKYINAINSYSKYGVSGLAEYGTEQNIYSLAIHQMIWARAVQGAPDPQWIAEAWDIADKKDGSDDGKIDPKLWIYQVYWEASKTDAADPKDRDSDNTAYIIQSSDCVVEGYDYTEMLSGTYLVYFHGSTSPWQVGVYRRLNPVNGKEYLDVMSQYNADK